MTLGMKRSGEALRAAAGDLARVWRASRHVSGAPFSPGLLDGLIEEYIERVAEALLLGQPPEEAWAATGGVVRVLPGDAAAGVLADEWRLALGVLLSGCDAMGASTDAAEAIRRAIDVAVAGTDALLAGNAPARVLVVVQLAGFRPRDDPRSDGPR